MASRKTPPSRRRATSSKATSPPRRMRTRSSRSAASYMRHVHRLRRRQPQRTPSTTLSSVRRPVARRHQAGAGCGWKTSPDDQQRLPTYLRQVTNDQRQNKGGIKVHPLDDDADSRPPRRCRGSFATSSTTRTRTSPTTRRSTGRLERLRLLPPRHRVRAGGQLQPVHQVQAHPQSADGVLRPWYHEQPDGSDQTKCAISSKIKKEDYKRFYPKADMAGFDALRGHGDWADWCDDLFIRVAEFYRIEYTDATLVMLSNGETGWKDKLVELPEGVTIVKEREGQREESLLVQADRGRGLGAHRDQVRLDPGFPGLRGRGRHRGQGDSLRSHPVRERPDADVQLLDDHGDGGGRASSEDAVHRGGRAVRGARGYLVAGE
jgi:hypothetical protein